MTLGNGEDLAVQYECIDKLDMLCSQLSGEKDLERTASSTGLKNCRDQSCDKGRETE